jgi:hypothetical protein
MTTNASALKAVAHEVYMTSAHFATECILACVLASPSVDKGDVLRLDLVSGVIHTLRHRTREPCLRKATQQFCGRTAP